MPFADYEDFAACERANSDKRDPGAYGGNRKNHYASGCVLSMDCPSCGETFKNEHGVRIHHTKVHGEQLGVEEKTCPYCGDVFESHEDRVYCSRICGANANKENLRSGGRVPIWACRKGGKWHKGRPKSEEFKSFMSELHSGEGNPNYGKYGEENPNYRGYEYNYGRTWSEQREKALERADYTCEHPGCTEDRSSLGKNPNVHHIIPFRMFDDSETANVLSNLLVLCDKHHRMVEPSKKLTEEVA